MNPESTLNTDAIPSPRLSERLAGWEHLLGQKDDLERRRAEAQAIRDACDLQLAEVEYARQMLERVERALFPVQVLQVSEVDVHPPVTGEPAGTEEPVTAEDPSPVSDLPVAEDVTAPEVSVPGGPSEDAVPQGPLEPLPTEQPDPEPQPQLPTLSQPNTAETLETPAHDSGPTEEDRQAVLGVLREKRRMMTESMILNQLRPWKMPHLRRVLHDLATRDLVKSADGGQRWGIV